MFTLSGRDVLRLNLLQPRKRPTEPEPNAQALCDGLASFTRGASNYNGGSVALVSEIVASAVLTLAMAVLWTVL